MPRGGSKDGNGSPIIGNNGLQATPDELTGLTRNMRENFIKAINKPPVNLHDSEEVTQAITDYFIDCEKAGKRPGNMGLYRALNLTRQDVNNVITGKSKSRVSPDCIDILKKAIQFLAEYREQLGAQGKLNPVTMIFWQKNYDGLEDATRLDVAPTHAGPVTITAEEARAALLEDKPIDASYKITENSKE